MPTHRSIGPTYDIRQLETDELGLIAQIDRAEHVKSVYRAEGGHLIAHQVDWNIPPWDPVGEGEHSVKSKIAWLRPIVRRGAAMFGAFDGSRLAGLMVVDPHFHGHLAWLVFLHVSRPYRGRGAGRELWNQATTAAHEAGSTKLYVSSTPSGPTVEFYLARGCRLADPPHPALRAMEPEDIHLIADVHGQ